MQQIISWTQWTWICCGSFHFGSWVELGQRYWFSPTALHGWWAVLHAVKQLVTVGDWGCLLRIVDRYIVPLDRSIWPNPANDPSGQVSHGIPWYPKNRFQKLPIFWLMRCRWWFTVPKMAVSLNEMTVSGIRAADPRIAEATQYLEWLQDLWRKIQAGSCGLSRFDPNQNSGFTVVTCGCAHGKWGDTHVHITGLILPITWSNAWFRKSWVCLKVGFSHVLPNWWSKTILQLHSQIFPMTLA